MDDRFFALWSEHRARGKGKFVFAYGFAAAFITLIVLTIAAFFADISGYFLLAAIGATSSAGLLFGLIIWSRYERLYQQRIDQKIE